MSISVVAKADILGHIQEVAKSDPVEACVMLVQSTTLPDPSDPMKLPWSVSAAILAFRRVVGPLTDAEEDRVRGATEDPEALAHWRETADIGGEA